MEKFTGMVKGVLRPGNIHHPELLQFIFILVMFVWRSSGPSGFSSR
jgi:hypothetical protein